MRRWIGIFCLLVLSCHAQMKEMWSYDLGWFSPLYCKIDAKNPKYLYATVRAGGLHVLEVSEKEGKLVKKIGIKELGGAECINLTQKGNLLYLATGNFYARNKKAGLAIVDITDPANPVVKGWWKSRGLMRGSHHVAIHGDYAYLAGMNFGVIVLDVSNPKSIKQVSFFLPDIHFPRKNPNAINHPNVRHSVVKGDELYIAYDSGGIRVLDINNPKKLVEKRRYINEKMKNKNQAYNELLIDGDVLYASVDYAGLEILDISNEKIKQLGWWNPWKAETHSNIWFNSKGHANELNLDKEKKVVYLSAGDSDIVAIDVKNLKKPVTLWTEGKLGDGKGTWGSHYHKGMIYATYIRTVVPFKGKYCGIKAFKIGE